MKERDLPFWVLTAGFVYASYSITHSSASFESKLLQVAALSAISFYIDNRGDTHYTLLDFKKEFIDERI
jgi:hypothetical protein